MNKPEIEFSEFIQMADKLEIRVGLITGAERIPKSKKLLKLNVQFGDEVIKTCVTNLGEKFEPEKFLMVRMPFIMNLKPSVMMGITSEVMIMVGETNSGDVEIENWSIGSKLM